MRPGSRPARSALPALCGAQHPLARHHNRRLLRADFPRLRAGRRRRAAERHAADVPADGRDLRRVLFPADPAAAEEARRKRRRCSRRSEGQRGRHRRRRPRPDRQARTSSTSTVEIAPNVQMVVQRSAISQLLPKGTIKGTLDVRPVHPLNEPLSRSGSTSLIAHRAGRSACSTRCRTSSPRCRRCRCRRRRRR